MKIFLKSIEKKLKENFEIEQIEIIDNTSKHKNHKFFNKDKFHLHLKIESKDLNCMNALKAHREVMKVLKKELKESIHALQITIK